MDRNDQSMDMTICQMTKAIKASSRSQAGDVMEVKEWKLDPNSKNFNHVIAQTLCRNKHKLLAQIRRSIKFIIHFFAVSMNAFISFSDITAVPL